MPFPILAALALAQTGYQAYQGYQQNKKADELERRGPIDPTPIAFRQAQQGLENQSNNAQVAGYGQIMDDVNEGISSSLGEAKRAGISSSNLLNVLTRLNQQKNKTVRGLAAQGASEQRDRMNRAYQAQMQRGQFQELGRQENNNAIGALRGAGMQNYYNAFTSGIGAVGYGMEGTKAAREAKAAEDMARDVQVEGVKFRTSDIPTEPDPNELGDMGGANPALTPTPEMAGLEAPNTQGLSFDPYKSPMQTPYVNSAYQNMFDSNAAAKRMYASRKRQPVNGSQMLRTAPYYQF